MKMNNEETRYIFLLQRMRQMSDGICESFHKNRTNYPSGGWTRLVPPDMGSLFYFCSKHCHPILQGRSYLQTLNNIAPQNQDPCRWPPADVRTLVRYMSIVEGVYLWEDYRWTPASCNLWPYLSPYVIGSWVMPLRPFDEFTEYTWWKS